MSHTPENHPIPDSVERDEYGVPLDASPEDFGIDPSGAGTEHAGTVLEAGSQLQAENTASGQAGSQTAATQELLDKLARRTNNAPPHSIEAEQAVLGSLMLEAGEAFDKISDSVIEQDFYQYNHRLIFRSISALAVAGSQPDHVTVSDWLKNFGLLEEAGGLNYIGALVEVVPSAGNVKEYAGIVRERSVLRQMITVANEIADSAYDAEGRTSKELLDEAETKVFAIADQTARASGGFHDIKSVLAVAIERISFLFESDAAITGLSTGFTELDEKTSGLQDSDLIIVAGRPSMGKTTFAMNIAENAAMEADAPVAIFSMEMPAEQLGMRMIASLGRVELQKLRTGRLAEQDWPRITSAITLLNQKRNVFIDDTPSLTPTELRARARRLARDNGLSLIVIDYLQLMQISENKENRATEISEISRSLKALAKELQVPIIALSQLNRSLEQRPDKRPVMSDLRESGAIEQDADVIMFIYRDEVYNPEDEASKGRAEILIRKQRNGPIGAVNLTFLGQYTRFENYAPEIMTGDFS
ncbi:MAG: replicative DNA helicase [Granulosicoccus sp.]|nr:replicative DNA helicase [Granulosicoccus sp.]